MDTILFLGTGNHYRSRFAEEYFNYRAIRLGSRWRADSRGLRQNMESLHLKGTISSQTAARLARLSITPIMASRAPLSVSIRDFQNATKVIAVCEREHRPMMAELFPMYKDMIDYWNIENITTWPPEKALPMLQNNIDYFLRLNSPVLTPETMNSLFA